MKSLLLALPLVGLVFGLIALVAGVGPLTVPALVANAIVGFLLPFIAGHRGLACCRMRITP